MFDKLSHVFHQIMLDNDTYTSGVMRIRDGIIPDFVIQFNCFAEQFCVTMCCMYFQYFGDR